VPFEGEAPHEGNLSACNAARMGTSPSSGQCSIRPATFPLVGDWDGVLVYQGTANHLVLHMNTTPEGKMTALLDHVDQNLSLAFPRSAVRSTAVV
jgi:hypothetical protein